MKINFILVLNVRVVWLTTAFASTTDTANQKKKNHENKFDVTCRLGKGDDDRGESSIWYWSIEQRHLEHKQGFSVSSRRRGRSHRDVQPRRSWSWSQYYTYDAYSCQAAAAKVYFIIMLLNFSFRLFFLYFSISM